MQLLEMMVITHQKELMTTFEGIMLAFVVILSIAVALAAVIVSIIIFIRLYRYRKAGVNDRAYNKYHDYLRRKKKNILS